MSMKPQPTSSSSSYENSSSSSEEEETDYESEPELVADSKIAETSSTPKTTATSLSEVEPDSPVVKPPADSSSKVEAPVTIASSSSSEEEETDSEAETEQEVETAVKPPADPSSNVEAPSEEETDSESETEQEAKTDSLPVKPPADSTSKVEDPVTIANSSSEEEERNSESETEQEVETAVKPPADPSSNVEAPSEEETDSESETEPVVDSKIVETSSEPNTTTNSLSEVEPDSPAVKPPADSNDVKTSEKPVIKKRSFETDEGEADEGEAKRVKMISGGDKKSAGQETKKNCFQRVWTEEDEITILQGIIDYQNENESSSFDDKTALYERLKMFLSFDARKNQFVEKIRSLKKKYCSNLGKEMKRGEEPVFSKPHDLEVFRLSKFVWGDEGIIGNAIEVEPPLLKLLVPAVKKKEFVSVVKSLARFGVDDLVTKDGWSKLSLEDKKTLEEECEALQLEELRFYSRKSRFIHDAVTKMAEASQRDL